MGDKTKIEWSDATWNPILGCSKVSPGCKNCYAIRTAHRLQQNPNPKIAKAFEGLTKIEGGKPNWTGRVNFVADRLDQPLRWKEPRMIFVNSQSDLFHEGVTDEQIDQIFAVMALSPQHTYQVLTKRPDRMRSWFNRPNDPAYSKTLTNPAAWYVWRWVTPIQSRVRGREGPVCPFRWTEFSEKDSVAPWPLPNIWLGVSCENQEAADERVPLLLQTPAAVRWVSAEPLLGPIDLTAIKRTRAEGFMRPLDGRFNKINWIVAGGESGPGARPMHPAWARSLRDQCQAAGVPFFYKQTGEWTSLTPGRTVQQFKFDDGLLMHKVGKKAAGRLLDGREWNEYPEVRS